jgi:hypothetical protein
MASKAAGPTLETNLGTNLLLLLSFYTISVQCEPHQQLSPPSQPTST